MRVFPAGDQGGHSDLVVPRPAVAVRPLAALGLLPLALAIAGLVPARGGLALGAACSLAALARGGREWRRLRRLRERADEQLLHGGRPGASPLLAWRATELTAVGNRRVLSRSLQGIVDELERRVLPGASALDRVAARPHAELIGALATRLRRHERQVSPVGVLLVERLLTEGSGPLYARARSSELGSTLKRCLAALEGASGPAAASGQGPGAVAHTGRSTGARRTLAVRSRIR